MIRAYYGRWEEMLNGPIDGTVEILKEIKTKDQHKLIALTNWSAETFPIALGKYDFLHWFHGRVVSGEEKTRKPFMDIYTTLLARYNINPQEAVFVDDNVRNLIPAEELGIKTIHFTSSESLRQELVSLGVL
jgi:2-haloacid dehalogenase